MAVALASGIVAVSLAACSGSSKPHAQPLDSTIAEQQIAAPGIADTGSSQVSAATSNRDATPNGPPSHNGTPADGAPTPTGRSTDTNISTHPDTGATPTTTRPGEGCQTKVAPASCSPTTTAPPSSSGDWQPPAPNVIAEPGDSCVATASGYGDVGAGVDSNACRYRASSAAGYQASGTWALWIDRSGTTLYLSSTSDPDCAAAGLIQPGDVVTVQAGWGGPSVISAGPAFHC